MDTPNDPMSPEHTGRQQAEEGQEESLSSLIERKEYERALEKARNNTFEKAYCYYKLGKHKSCLKTAGKKEGQMWSTLRMQAHYALDRHDKALQEAASLPLIGELLVNYAASLALDVHGKKGEEAEEIVKQCEALIQKEPVALLKQEAKYNLGLRFYQDPQEHIRYLEQVKAPEGGSSLIEAEIMNLSQDHDKIRTEGLSKRNRAIVEYNKTRQDNEFVPSGLKKFQREVYGKSKEVLRFLNASSTKSAIQYLEQPKA